MRFRSIRFGLRSLILCLTCVALAAGLLGIRAQRLNRQARIYGELKSICKEGSYVISAAQKGEIQNWCDYAVGYDPGYEVVHASIHDRRVLIEATDVLAQYPNLATLDLDQSACDNDMLAHITHTCPKLKVLSLSHTEITDECVDHLAMLADLETLELVGTSVTGEGFAIVGKRCPKLRDLNLEKSQLSAAGLKEIAETCPFLEWINVSYTDITAIDLVVLSRAVHLNTLWASGLEIPDQVYEELRFLMPEVELNHDRASNNVRR